MKLDTKLKYGSIGLVILLIGAGIAFMSMDGGSDSSNSARPTLENKAEKSRPKKANHRSTRKGKIQGARRGSEKDSKLETRVKPSMFLDNEEVAQMALDQFEQALSDISLGDRERAKIVSLASTVITDSDALEQIFMEISNMRNSVAANTIFTICQDGTPEAKKLIVGTMELVTGEDIKTVEDLAKWAAENPDGEFDEDLYGPLDTD